MGDPLEELKKQNALLAKTLQEEKAARGTLEAKLEVLLQQVSAKSEPERIQMLEKQELAKRRKAVRDEAIAIAQKSMKKGERPTHVRYVTGSYYQRKGVLYAPGTTLKIPVSEEPAQDWRAWKPAHITRPVAIDPDARGTPFGELNHSSSAIAAVKRDEMKAAIERGDVIISSTTPDQGEVQPPTPGEQLQQAPATEQGPESALSSPRASDTDVG